MLNLNKKSEDKGITLIALVITIIVLLILAGISISMLSGDNSILQKATEAKTQTEEKSKEEQIQIEVMGSIGTDGKIDVPTLKTNLGKIGAIVTGDYLPLKVELGVDSFKIDDGGNVRKIIIADRTNIKIGDYVNYTPTVQAPYSKDKLGEAYTGSTNNSLDINQESLNWKVLDINEDGSIDLIAEPTSQTINFSGATGYNNGVYIMHDICKSLYSNITHSIEARSISLEDFEENLTENGRIERDEYNKTSTSNPQYGQTNYEKWNTTYSDNYYPNIYAKEIGSGIESVNVKIDGIKATEKNKLDLTIGNAAYKHNLNTGLTSTQTVYYIKLNEINYGEANTILKRSSSPYWVASRFVECSYCSCFGLRSAKSNIGGAYMFRSDNYADGANFSIRPMVTIDSDITLTISADAGTDSNKPHIINW